MLGLDVCENYWSANLESHGLCKSKESPTAIHMVTPSIHVQHFIEDVPISLSFKKKKKKLAAQHGHCFSEFPGPSEMASIMGPPGVLTARIHLATFKALKLL